MVNFFQLAVERLVDLGFYNFLLPFILFSTVLYALLRKTQVLGDSPLIHGIVSVSVGLFVFGLPVIVGFDMTFGLTKFLTQASIILLVFVFGFLVASFFYPNLTERLPQFFETSGTFNMWFWIIVAIAVGAGLFGLAGGSFMDIFKSIGVPVELGVMTLVIFIVLIIFLIVTMSSGREVK